MHYHQKKEWALTENDVTDESIFNHRRSFIKKTALLATTFSLASFIKAKKKTNLQITNEKIATSYNNFYEFGLDKEKVIKNTRRFEINPWEIEIKGLCENQKKVDLYSYTKRFNVEERIYRFRCVEKWAMVVPWMGIAFRDIIKDAKPLKKAKYVRFVTAYKPKQMPGIKTAPYYPWPYYEGLRLDEALNPLTLLTIGMYGKALPKQNGAPVRIITPWKYGYKSIKSIVSIEFTNKKPATFWNDVAPKEYGFFSNVNPKVPHPRWSQKWERLIGSNKIQKTLPYNGYEKQVAYLYKT